MNLKEIRKEMGVTQMELSKLTGIHQGDISNIENGKNCTVKTLQKVADALGLKLVVEFKYEE